MDIVPAGQVARTWQALFHFQIIANDAQNDLSDQLLTKWDFAVFGKPKTHLEIRVAQHITLIPMLIKLPLVRFVSINKAPDYGLCLGNRCLDGHDYTGSADIGLR
jgi:hypothetical protein